MNRVNEGGSVLSFVVIGVVLALLLVSGVYFVRQQMTTRAETKPQTTNEPQTPPSDQKSDEPKAEDTNKSATNDEQKASTGSTTPSEMPRNATSPALPQTGPAESVTAIIAVALLSATFTAYLRSRRDYASL